MSTLPLRPATTGSATTGSATGATVATGGGATRADQPSERVGEQAVPGRVRISAAVVAKLAARAALDLPEVGPPAPRLPGHGVAGTARWGFPGRSRSRLPRASAEIEGHRAFVDLTISVRWPAPLAEVTAALTRHLRDRVASLTELTVADVRITVAALVRGGRAKPLVR